MIEFGILAMPFFLLLMGIFQMGLLFFEQEIFQTAITDASRSVYTGQASANGYTLTTFKQQVCNRLPSLMPCSSVAVDVRPYSDFSSAGRYMPVDSSGKYDPTKATFDAGDPKGIVVVTGYFVQPVLFTMMTPYVSNAGKGQVMLCASAAFRNEPYGATS